MTTREVCDKTCIECGVRQGGVEMIKLHAAVVAVVSSLAILLPAPLEVVNAGGQDWVQTITVAPDHWFRGVVAFPPFVPNVVSYAPHARFVFVAEPPPVLSCRHSQETVVVPKDNGGTQDVTITRC